MKSKSSVAVLTGIFFLSFLPLTFSQQEAPQPQAVQPLAPEEEVSWLWGEVKAVDPAASSLSVMYMDYQTDEEKEMVLTIDAKTQFEAINGLSGIKVGDTASIDYAVEGGRNVARNISIETIEAMPEAPAPPEQAEKEPLITAPKSE